MRIAMFSVSIGLYLSSCSIYDSDFECPPGKGVGCASVGEVMEMIIENEQGEDQFIKYRGRSLVTKQDKKNSGLGEKKLYVVRSEKGDLVLVPNAEGENR